MNLYYVQARHEDGINVDLMVVAGDAATANSIWWAILGNCLDAGTPTVNLVDLHIARPIQGYIECGTFKLIPVELP